MSVINGQQVTLKIVHYFFLIIKKSPKNRKLKMYLFKISVILPRKLHIHIQKNV